MSGIGKKVLTDERSHSNTFLPELEIPLRRRLSQIRRIVARSSPPTTVELFSDGAMKNRYF